MPRTTLLAAALLLCMPTFLPVGASELPGATPVAPPAEACTAPLLTEQGLAALRAAAPAPIDLSDLPPLPVLPAGEPRDPPLLPVECNNHLGPGARMTSPVGCTMNFAFTDPQGRYYLGTAGHCTSVGQRVGVNGFGQVGTTVYSISAGAGSDFALVRLDPGLVPDPAMCHWGGPTGIATDAAGNDDGLVKHFGYGLVWGMNQFTRPRMGYTDTDLTMDPTNFGFVGFAAAGDSGSPIMMEDGKGLGIITHGGGVFFFVPAGSGTRLDRAISLAEAGLGVDLTLMTAPLA